MTEQVQLTAIAHNLAVDTETRTIRGTITAYGVPTSDYRQIVLHPGSLRPRMPLSRVKMLVDHDQRQPVGYMSELDSDAMTAAFKIAPGLDGDKALSDASPDNKLRDGLSVGFIVLAEEDAAVYDPETGQYHIYAAELVEVSLCAIPAYQDAGVTEVKASHAATPPTPKENPEMTDTLTSADLTAALDTALAAQSEEHERALEARLATFAPGATQTGPQWATFGAFMKDFVGGSTEAASFYETLAYTGAGSGDSAGGNAWVADAIHLIDQRRPIMNSFTREPLPAEGMTLEYLQLDSNTTVVAKQAAEGDDLTFGKVKLKSATAPINTYGGYTEISKQIIDRANSAYVSTAFKAMDLEYARATEAAVRALVKAQIAAQIVAGENLDLAFADVNDPYAWLDLIVDATELFDDRSYSLSGALVSKDVFKRMIRLEDTAGNSLMRVYGEGVNQTGKLDLTSLKGNLANVEFKLLPGAAANTMSFYDPLAVTSWESPGAPHQLQDQNIINLTEAFSKYGYLAAASQFPDALLPVEIAVA